MSSLFPNAKEKAEIDIKHAVGWGILLSFLSLVAVILHIQSFLKNRTSDEIFSVSLTLVQFLSLVGITFGIYRKSHFCAVLLALFFLLRAVLLALIGAGGWGNPFFQLAVILIGIIYCYKGIRGTFLFHKLKSVPETNLEDSAQTP